MNGIVLLAAWCAAASAQEYSVPDLVHNPVLKMVLVNKNDREAYDEFVDKDLDRVVAVARAIGVESLPVDRAHFTLYNPRPHYSYPDRFASLGAIPRQGKAGVGHRAVSIHELSHAMLFEYVALKHGGPPPYSPSQWRLLSPLNELFADMVAVLLLNDPEAIIRSVSGLGPAPRDERAAAKSREEMTRRSVDGEGVIQCDPSDPVSHYWFNTTRRTLWGDVFVGKHKRSPRAVEGIVQVLAEEVYVEWNKQLGDLALRDRAQLERLAAQAPPKTVLFMPAPTPPKTLTGSELLGTPVQLKGQVEEMTDARLRDALRRRFGLPPL